MNIKYIKDEKGKTTDVVLSIKDWDKLKTSFPDIEEISDEIPKWHQVILEQRMESIKKNPDKLLEWDSVQEEIKNKYCL